AHPAETPRHSPRPYPSHEGLELPPDAFSGRSPADRAGGANGFYPLYPPESKVAGNRNQCLARADPRPRKAAARNRTSSRPEGRREASVWRGDDSPRRDSVPPECAVAVGAWERRAAPNIPGRAPWCTRTTTH